MVVPRSSAKTTSLVARFGSEFFAEKGSRFIPHSFWRWIAGHENTASIRHRRAWPFALAIEENDVRNAESGGASAAQTRGSPLATGGIAASGTQTPPQPPHHNVKIDKAGQRACNQQQQ